MGIPIECPLDTAGVKASRDIATGFPVHVPDGNMVRESIRESRQMVSLMNRLRRRPRAHWTRMRALRMHQ